MAASPARGMAEVQMDVQGIFNTNTLAWPSAACRQSQRTCGVLYVPAVLSASKALIRRRYLAVVQQVLHLFGSCQHPTL